MKNWWNKYVGIPYKLHGRNTDGLDCWGLVRLVYKDEKNIDLPSLSEEYYSSDNFKQNEEVISNNNENWTLSEEYTTGDVVLFRINGAESHVGIVIDDNRFLHSKEGVGVTIEKLNSTQWRKRVAGFYKYNKTVEAYIHAAMHPLKTVKLNLIATPGQTLQEIVDSLQTNYGIESKIFNNHILFLDGYPIAKDQWSEIKLKEGQHVDYRVVPTGGGSGRLLATLALVAVAWWAAPYIAGAALGVGGAGFGTAGYAALGTAVSAGAVTAGSVALASSLATAGINIVGGLLINAIFPIRSNKFEQVQFRNTNLLQGGSNQENQYGAIPVILGRVRYTPPLGAKTFIENSGDTSYMRMLAIWGYGPLQISNMRLGNVPLEYYDEIEHQTLYGTSDDTIEAVRTFDTIYGRDVTQQSPNLTLQCQRQIVSAVTVTGGNTFQVTINGQGKGKTHQLQLNDPIQTLFYYTSIESETLVRVNNLIVTDIVSDTVFVCTVSTGSYTNGTYSVQTGPAFVPYFVGGNPYFETSISQEVDRIGITLGFPQGLYGIREENGSAATLGVTVSIQIRPVGETSWNEAYEKISARTFNFSKAYYNIDNDTELEKVYQWHYINIDSNGKAVIRSGCITNNKTSNPSSTMLKRLQDLEGVGFDDMTFNYLPTNQSQEETMYKICVYGDNITDVIDMRTTAAVTDCTSSITPGTGLTAGLSLSFTDGMIFRINETDPYYDLSKGSFSIKDIIRYGYSKTIYFNVSRGPYEIRIKRTSSNTHLTDQIMDTCVLSYVTGYTYVKPISLPRDSFGDRIKVARTALKIRATGQINGLVEGVTATVQTIGEDYVSGVWTDGLPIRNPAALFRHVLKHQGNAKASSVQLDETTIAEWYTYCKTNGFNFDKVVLEQTSLLEILKDIAAAGRASPTIVDGKWSIVVDKPNSVISQHFTPHNSWGFEGVRGFPQLPHAFRINFNNSEKGFQVDEMIVYNDGYTSTNATLFETIEFPGVTEPKIIYKHARFHLAQLKLRPETYTLNADIESILCTRGDRVKVVHDVPQWGIDSARINNIIPYSGTVGTSLILNESFPMDGGVLYAVRIRREDNTSFVKTVRPALTDGYYNTLELVTEASGIYTPYNATSDNLHADDLLLFGQYNTESVDLIVQSIEPMDKLSAKLTLVDYSPDIYNSDSEVIPAFNSQITTPPNLLQRVITYRPSISVANIVSNETVMEKVGPLSFVYKMFVPVNPLNLLKASSQKIDAAEAEVKLTTGTVWQNTQRIKLEEKGFLFSNLAEQESYDIRVRYVSSNGMVGSWSDVATHTVVGKQTPPQTVNNVTVTAEGDLLRFNWEPNPEIDIVNYEVREDTNFGTAGFLYLGQSPTCTVTAPIASVEKTWYIKAIDSASLYSQTARLIVFTVQKPSNIVAVSQKVVKTNRTTVELSVDWEDIVPTTYNIAGYEIRLADSNWGENTDYVYKGRATSARLTGVDSTVNTNYYIKSFDENNNYSNVAYEFTHDVTFPDSMASATVSTTRAKSDLRFEILSAPAIPNDFETYEFRVGKVDTGGIPDGTTDNFWDDPNVVVIESTINKASLSLALFDSPRYTNEGLKYRVAVRMRDRSGNYSEASALGSIIVTKIT